MAKKKTESNKHIGTEYEPITSDREFRALATKFDAYKKETDQVLETLKTQLRATVDQLALLKERNRLR